MRSDVLGEPFGRYTLLAPLRQGGMGALYLASQGDPGMQKLCVIKTALPQLAGAESVERFRDEAKLVVRLSHGNLVPVFDAGTVHSDHGDELYLAMEYVDGKDLRTVWNRCAQMGIAFPVDVAVYLARELLRGLHHAHSFASIALVHRDVSPSNVLLSFSGEVRLTDFGLAASAMKRQHTAPGVVYGKVSYMSPEQARGERLDGRADLYSVGLILWELLTGRQRFPRSDRDLIEKVRAPERLSPSAITSRVETGLEEIVMRALEPRLTDRYPDCEAFRAALAGHLAKMAPTIDNTRVSQFLARLFGDEIARERAEHQNLLDRAAHLKQGSQRTLAAVRPSESGGLLGATLDRRYRVRKLIGEGGMGLVYEGEHLEIGRRVAIKVLHAALTRDAELVARFRSEARAAARIGHPHIVEVFDSGTTANGAVYLVMEYLEGRDLCRAIMAEGQFDVQRAVAVARQICEALEAAHTAGILHRDLKPENIFLTEREGCRDFVKVLDFGIAKALDKPDDRASRMTRPGLTMGTPEYMAPEQATGGTVDRRGDIYSVGAILYEMLTGRPPHEGNHILEVLTRKVTTPPTPIDEFRSDVPHALTKAVMRALSVAPTSRPESMAAFASELDLAVRPVNRPTSWHGIDRRSGDRRARSRSSHLAGLIASVVALGATVVLVFALSASHIPSVGRMTRPKLVEEAELGAHGFEHSLQSLEPKPVLAIATRPIIPTAPPAEKEMSASRLPRPERVSAATTLEVHHLLRAARSALAAGRYPEAESLFTKLRISGTERAASLVGLAEVSFQKGSYTEAARLGRKALEAGGGIAARMVLGNSEFRLERYGQAIEQYEAVLRLDRAHSEARANLQAAQRRKGT
jgi:serine/threonine protein kinase